MDAVLAEIGRSKWIGDKPVGPFGMFVKLKDPRWAEILRNQLGSIMSSFAVTNAKDRSQLSQILQRTGKLVLSYPYLPSSPDRIQTQRWRRDRYH